MTLSKSLIPSPTTFTWDNDGNPSGCYGDRNGVGKESAVTSMSSLTSPWLCVLICTRGAMLSRGAGRTGAALLLSRSAPGPHEDEEGRGRRTCPGEPC